MSRTPARFPVEVPDVGTFIFRRRTMRDQLLMQAEFQQLSAGHSGQVERLAAEAMATLPRLTVEAPPGWDYDALDPLDPEDWAKLGQVFGGLRDAEGKFRGDVAPKRPGVGAGDGTDGGIPVPPPLQPPPD